MWANLPKTGLLRFGFGFAVQVATRELARRGAQVVTCLFTASTVQVCSFKTVFVCLFVLFEQLNSVQG